MKNLEDKIDVIGAKIDLILRKLNKHQEVIEKICPDCKGTAEYEKYDPVSRKYNTFPCYLCGRTGKVRAIDLKFEG